MERALRNIIAILLGILFFFTIIFLLGLLLAVAFSFLTKIRIIALVLNSSIASYFLPFLVFVPAFYVTHFVIEEIGKNNYLPFLVFGIVLMIVYIPSGIISMLANDAYASWADVCGIVIGANFIKEAFQLKK